jgi:hypothetical protein
MKRSAVLTLVAVCGLLAWQTDLRAQSGDPATYTRDTFVQWFDQSKDAVPQFKAGDVLTHADLEKVRPFMFPGYFEQFEKWNDQAAQAGGYEPLQMKVLETYNVTPHQVVLDCNEKYQKQVSLADDGAMENYVCGYPFANDAIKLDDPQAGLKIAWNYDKRWYWRGYFVANALTTWLRFGGTHTPPEPEMPPQGWMGKEVNIQPDDWNYDVKKIYGGGGTYERSLGTFYHKAYMSHLPMFPDSNYQVPGVDDAEAVYWKEFTAFFSPYDVRGTAFIIARYNDPRRTDDGWAYVPSLRRVRRISAEVKSDSLMGTEHTLEDFYGFSGRPLEWDWKFWGRKKFLAVHAKTEWDDDGAHYGGPDGWLFNDVWQMRDMFVVERIPRDPRHPYKSAVMAIDPQTWETWNHIAFDRKGTLWKLWQWGYSWSDDAHRYVDMNHGRSAIHWRNVDTVDIQNGRGNLWREYAGGLPDFSTQFIVGLYDLNRLTELHR